MGIRKGDLPSTFVTRVDLENIAKVAGFEIVRQRQCGLLPLENVGIRYGHQPRYAAGAARPLAEPDVGCGNATAVPSSRQGLSCVIPARNERGNIENALTRFPDMGREAEIIFVEGHSTDGTWEEILRVSAVYRDQFRILAVQQPGKGKADAVRLGFSQPEKICW